jgi:ketosteroid isomerase-like protein
MAASARDGIMPRFQSFAPTHSGSRDPMRQLLVALSVAVLSVAPVGCSVFGGVTLTPEETAVMAPVHQFVDGINAGDAKQAMAACTDSVAIIDDFAPHVWSGAGAAGQWLKDFDAAAKRDGITDGNVTLYAPWHVDVTGDRAYVVAAVDYSYKLKGKSIKEKDSTLTVALQKSAAGWRITGWAWSKG